MDGVRDLLTDFALAGVAVLFAAWAAIVGGRWMARQLAAMRPYLAAFLVFTLVAMNYAQKSGTNEPPRGASSGRVESFDGRVEPFDGRVERVEHVEGSNESTRSTRSTRLNTPAPLFMFEYESTNETYSYAMPINATRYEKWWRRGAYEDVFEIDLDGMLFPLGEYLCDSLWVYSWGMAGRSLADASNRVVATGGPMSAVPGVSRFWSAEGAGGGRLLTWENFFLNRDTNTPVSAQLELMPSGDYIARSNLVERLYRRVNPDDWDEDGIPNDDDLDPYFYDGDNFGPHQMLPEGANTNHYYWVDIVVEQANARVTFVGDGYSHLPDPDFIARAGVTNRVVLLLGKAYGICCSMPVLVVAQEDEEVIVSHGGDTVSVVWPVQVVFGPVMRSGHSTTATVSPQRASGGAFSWPDNFCCYSLAAGVVPIFDCDGTCGCGGCSTGDITYEIGGYEMSFGGVQCGCHHEGSPEPEGGGEDPQSEPPSGPSVSVSFSNQAIIFEDEYVNATNAPPVPRRSTDSELTCEVYGGTNGGHYAFALYDGGRLARKSGSYLPRSGTVRAGETFRIKIKYEALSASAGVGDISAVGTFTENGTAREFASDVDLTAVKVEIQPTVSRMGCPNRHRMGIREYFRLNITPSAVPCTVICAADWKPPQSDSDPYQCPLRAAYNGINMSIAGISYAPQLTVVEPTGIVCERGWNYCAPGYVAMKLDPYVSPLDVSFEGIAMMEVPTTTVGPSGYFTNTFYSSIWYHTTDRGAGEWYRIGEGNHFFDDVPAFAEVCFQPFSDGNIDWEIILGWGERDSLETDVPVATIPTHYHQVFTIDEYGALRIDKFGQWIKQFADGSVTNSSGIISIGGQ